MGLLGPREPKPDLTEQDERARVIVASARRIDLTDKRAIKALGKHQEWQSDAVMVFHSMGKVKYADRFLANTCARLRWYAAVASEHDDEPPIPVEDSDVSDACKAAAQDMVARFRLANGGHGGIMRAIVLGLEVAGECYLIGYPDRDAEIDPETRAVVKPASPERWEVRSVMEVSADSEGKVRLRQRPDAQPERLPEDCMFVRIWEPDPFWPDLPDSALRSVLSDADSYLIMERQIRAIGRSRMTAGLFAVPSELSFGPPDPTQDEAKDPLSQMLLETFINPIADESDPSAVVPTILRGKAEYLKADVLRHIPFNREVDKLYVELRKETQNNVVDGLNLPSELVNGMSELAGLGGGNVAAMIDASTFSAHVEPRAIGVFDALTSDAFRPMLKLYPGVSADEADRVFIWYDESEVVTQPDRSEAANDAHDRLTISDDAYRKARGFNETDAPTEDEMARRIGLKRGIMDGAITEQLLSFLLGQTFVDQVERLRGTQVAIEAEAKDTGTAPSVQDVEDAAPEGEGIAAAIGALARLDRDLLHTHPEWRTLIAAAQPNPGRRLGAIDRDLFVRLRVAADAALSRALDRAGARLRSKVAGGGARTAAARTAVQNVENRLVAATLGPAMVASLAVTEDEMLADSFAQLRIQWEAWVRDAQHAALDVAQAAWGLADDQRPALEQRQQEDRDEGWGWFHAALVALARAKLYDQQPVTAGVRTTAGLIGESDPSLQIPAAMVREAMTRAGGSAGLEVRQTQAGGVELLTEGGRRPAGGVATGQVVLTVAADYGFPLDWYEWEHGNPAHPFEPHAQLAGVSFYAEDDPNLASDDDWIGPYYFPGDHSGCTCSAVPVFGTGPDRTQEDLIG